MNFALALLQTFSKIIVGWFAVAVCLAVTAIGGSFIFMALEPLSHDTIANSQHVYGTDFNEHKLVSLRINGYIDGQPPADPFYRLPGVVYGYEIKDQLDDAAADTTVKGVILEIDSPGGTIYGSQAIAEGVKAYREKTKKPVYAHVSGLAASGGYWVAASADRILADLGSSIGSIGVIEGPFFYFDKVLSFNAGTGSVVTQNGIQAVTISAGKGKDSGDPFRKLTAEEVASIQESVNNDYTAFVEYVGSRRQIPTDTLRNKLGALVFGTQSATVNKLIDSTAGREAAYNQLAAAAHLKKDDFEVVRPGGPVAAADNSLAGQVASFLRQRQAATKAPATAASSSLCSFRGVKAYYGDLSQLCTK